MLLSTASTVFFWIGVGIAGLGLLLLVTVIGNRRLDEDERFGGGAIGVVMMIFGSVIFGLIAHGGMKAQDIQDGLSSQGFTVVSIDTDRNQATVVNGDKLVDVQVYKTGYPQAYHAYLACPVDSQLTVSTDNCAAVPK